MTSTFSGVALKGVQGVVSDNKAIAARIYQDVLRNRNPSVLDELIDPEIVDHDAIAQGWGNGRAGFRRHVAYFHEVFSEMQVTIEHVFAEGEKVVAIWMVSGIQSGVMLGDQLWILLQLGHLGKYAPQFQAGLAVAVAH